MKVILPFFLAAAILSGCNKNTSQAEQQLPTPITPTTKAYVVTPKAPASTSEEIPTSSPADTSEE